ncbi:Superfamily II DNA and RNA helicase [Salegentibacter holothuriorum]|uniref:Superfamily II DNA and RNA helicase n=1 Tax=Salegentibacter holothuriorum TaxID=241145 RepID=A0A1T5AAW3_9FLAO|nr:DEAD/DEAH box helicase [Salegentibacter holothuriorum]SKB32161.1 Superfamily II DNA and RNA helicase [Salegentibacter holothuriorum]
MQTKNLQEILQKLEISQLNAMQQEAYSAIIENQNTVLLSPTGSGKTLAFLLPLLESLDPDLAEVQAVILVPSRELAIQIEQVTREMGAGFKANAVYGGRAFSKDKIELQHAPAILIGTPGRIADHFRRETFAAKHIKTLVLDEFDKSLEVGFENEMREIISALTSLEKRILTSATQNIEIPAFVGLKNGKHINYLKGEQASLEVKTIEVNPKKKLESLVNLLSGKAKGSGIIFCNFKDTIAEVSDFLNKHQIEHGIFSGGMEQKDRERSLIKFRNGTHRLLIATDLAARGIDVPEINFIIHYQLPFKASEFTHRNGRTARMHKEGIAYVLSDRKKLPDFIKTNDYKIKDSSVNTETVEKITLFISGGRKDKISKGDIAGLFLKQGNLEKEELGLIELKQDCAFVAVPQKKAEEIIGLLNNSKLKKKKVRVRYV